MSFIDAARRGGGRSLVSPRQIVASGLCIGCGACAVGAAGQRIRMDFDCFGQLKPSGPARWHWEPSEHLSSVCPFSPLARDETELAEAAFSFAKHSSEWVGRYEAAFVGYAAEGEYRAHGSSGGLVSWFAAELLSRGLVDGVAHVGANGGVDGSRAALFQYRISRSLAELQTGAKSRYYPVELSGVLKTIRNVPGRYAIVGIPCFIKAVRLQCLRDPVLAERIVFTLGLFCGHMKSARMAESFAWQLGAGISDLEAIDYRVKDPWRPANWYRAQIRLRDGTTREKDWWHLVDGDWGAGFFQNSACNYCDDVVAETADISFGDAWLEPYSSDGRGTNVVIIRSPELLEIARAGVEQGRLALSEVGEDFVVATQAAGFRQRREGLSFRLAWPRLGTRARKRVDPRWRGLSARRMIIYAMRATLSAWSHRIFWLARKMRRPWIYMLWARIALSSYHGLAYSRGFVGRIIEFLRLRGSE